MFASITYVVVKFVAIAVAYLTQGVLHMEPLPIVLSAAIVIPVSLFILAFATALRSSIAQERSKRQHAQDIDHWEDYWEYQDYRFHQNGRVEIPSEPTADEKGYS